MSDIKEEMLVKAWDKDPSVYMIGKVQEVHPNNKYKYDVYFETDEHSCFYENAVEIPAELAKQLEELK